MKKKKMKTRFYSNDDLPRIKQYNFTMQGWSFYLFLMITVNITCECFQNVCITWLNRYDHIHLF